MSVPAPHFLLFSASQTERRQWSEADQTSEASKPARGRWHFLLEALNGPDKLEATDEEPEAEGERLELLAVVRGLEALDQPSRVTLVTPSTYVSRGLRYGLDCWEESNWEWESFGRMAPVKNRDLWQRVRRAMQYHDVECRNWRFDAATEERAAEQAGSQRSAEDHVVCSTAEENNDRGEPGRVTLRIGNAAPGSAEPRRSLARRMADKLTQMCGGAKQSDTPADPSQPSSERQSLATV